MTKSDTGLSPDNTSWLRSRKQAKEYNRAKIRAGLLSTLASFLFLVFVVFTSLSRDLEGVVRTNLAGDYAVVLMFILILGSAQKAITLPISYYSGFTLEHRFNLSNQTVTRWAIDVAKGSLISLPILAFVVLALFYSLRTFGNLWWIPVGFVTTAISIILARIAPTLIFPLFYKFVPLQDGTLKSRIMDLCSRAGVNVKGIFSFDMSTKTKKANAAFTGIGKSKRIILGDTLIENFSEDEIETIFAHELGHYKHRHIAIGMGVSIVSTFIGLYVASYSFNLSIPYLGFSSISEIAALPLLALWLSVFGLITTPLGNFLSRRHERQADAYALRITRNKVSFISAMRTLSAMNLADPAPHPIVEFLLYSHPSISKRIRMAEAFTL